MKCPRCGTEMVPTKKTIKLDLGEIVTVVHECMACPTCGLEAGTLEQVGKLQKKIKDLKEN